MTLVGGQNVTSYEKTKRKDKILRASVVDNE